MAGPVALRHLRQKARTGEVLAAFRHSAYVRLGADDVVCLCSPELRCGPLNVTFEAPETLFADLRPGATASVTRAGSLELDGLTRLDLDSVVEWQPARIMGRDTWCEVESALAMLVSRLKDYRLWEGFAPLVRQVCTDWTTLAAPGRGELDALELAVPALRDLLLWLERAAGAGDNSPAPVASLIGLGPGLTPSGDDLLCGILVTLHATGRRHLASRLADTVMREAASGTSTISRAHLRCACQGLGADALHDALCALLACDAAALDRALDGLNRTGHSSGWDGLAGVVACLAVLEASRSP